jgi:hypothetical protein
MTDPNNYGQTIDFDEIKGRMTIDRSPDTVLGQTGYLNLVRTFFSGMKTHTDTATLVNNLLADANIANTNGFVAIVGHGSSGIIGAGIGRSLQVGPCLNRCISLNNKAQWIQLFEKLKDKGIKSLYLFSCFTGAGNDGAELLYDLANSINATVAAPTGRILIFQQGRFFKLENNAQWQVAQPAPAPKPATINMPPIIIPPFTRMNLFDDVQQNVEIFLGQVTGIGIGKPDQLDKWTELPSSQFVQLLGSINFNDAEDLEGGVMAGFITGAFTVRYKCPANKDRIEKQEDREFIIFNNRYVQDGKYPNIVYHCKESISNFFM